MQEALSGAWHSAACTPLKTRACLLKGRFISDQGGALQAALKCTRGELQRTAP